MEPATTIINLCGGIERVAQMTGRSEIRVRRWTYEKDRGGTNGLIPSDVQPVLLLEARKAGIDLKPHHFFASLPPLAAGDGVEAP